MPTMIPAELLKRALEPVALELLPADRKDWDFSLSEMQAMPVLLLSLAHSIKRIADVVTEAGGKS